ncbi:hypothetical protein [Neobacillus sp. SuZ13]|uniref:hypothetical protein n=1 Tax=Neobacillus sp. SuZ13 TaxID=3047875 RepID=UPI0024BF8268|nr:hypothetical protein [Neobacillus sp. SuZ13]WHY69287.1 hypothetical protein QNH17_11875 [Neobacillus sp. SuZ13]
MFFFVIFLIGLVLPFILIKVEFSWIIWIPAMIFFLAAILAVVKAVIFPGEGMADLAERIYVMIFGTAAIGSISGGVIAHFLKSKK